MEGTSTFAFPGTEGYPVRYFIGLPTVLQLPLELLLHGTENPLRSKFESSAILVRTKISSHQIGLMEMNLR